MAKKPNQDRGRNKVTLSLDQETARKLKTYAQYCGCKPRDVVTRLVLRELAGFVVYLRAEAESHPPALPPAPAPEPPRERPQEPQERPCEPAGAPPRLKVG